MRNTKLLLGACLATVLALGSLTGCNKTKSGEDKYDKDGRLILELKNVYFTSPVFGAFDGEDMYTQILNEKFGVHITPSAYDYDSWDEAVNIAMNGNNLTDAIHFNVKAYNFGSTYEKWVDDMMIKALPDDMSQWPNLQALINHASNIDALRINGKLYGIPIMNDVVDYTKDFSNMTYVYRRDWAKAIDEENRNNPSWEPVYREGDVYTWEEFNKLLSAFKTYPRDLQNCVILDEEWGFPSVTNFYKDAPHCFTKDENGRAINAFTSEKYIAGLDKAKELVTAGVYSRDQFSFTVGQATKNYLGDQGAILYDNHSLANYITLRKDFKADKRHANIDVNDATAILKIKDPQGSFAIEGIENWFSMTLFNYDISETKLHKILDVLDYLLTEEGTRLAVYGKEGYDYNIVDGKVELTDIGWEKDMDGNYGAKVNGAKFMRYMVTLGNDTKSYDPYTEMDAFAIHNAWQEEMKAAKAQNKLRIIKEPADIEWMSTKTKNDKTESILADANNFALKYAFHEVVKDLKDYDIDKYRADFDKDVSWSRILAEINEKLGK